MNMAIMDIPDLVPLARLVSAVLKPYSGRSASLLSTAAHELC